MPNDSIARAIADLKRQLENIQYVIKVLEDLSRGKRRRGRPPKIFKELMAEEKTAPRKKTKPRKKRKKAVKKPPR